MPEIRDARILIMATDGFEQSELEVPRDELRAAGATVQLATPNGKRIRGWDEANWGRTAPADLPVAEVEPGRYDALVLPGGQINPDLLRIDDDAMAVVMSFLDRGTPVAAICHAPWLLVQADAVRGRDVTSYPSIRRDLENAGARWIDAEVVVDGGIITSRSPKDLMPFIAAIIDEIEDANPSSATA
ncbi:type 1 glutamine amidotransferase domain-containing protein [Thalassobaculum sp.]|uniref:type 1 glutamine amidotransferase domain-containing protein n=1 Tax=Thalassobaculum sp. TaxID=2022740 RepID=UPI0032EC2441